MQPIQIINAMRENIRHAETAFTQGKCYQLYAMLKQLYPQAVAWYDPIVGHVYSEIDGLYYDILGAHQSLPEKSHLLSQEPRLEAQAKTWDYEVYFDRHDPEYIEYKAAWLEAAGVTQ